MERDSGCSMNFNCDLFTMLSARNTGLLVKSDLNYVLANNYKKNNIWLFFN